MRKLRRPNLRLPTLEPTGPGGQEKERRERAWKRNQNDEEVNKNFPSHWSRPDVRGALYAMHGWACAYCQEDLPRGDRGDVEHFRPKNLYWWLAYEFDNYLLSCTVCNSSFKSKKFPILPRSRRYGYSRRNRIDKENRALINPADDPVDGWIMIDFDNIDKEKIEREGVRVGINPTLSRKESRRCERTIKFFKLNKDSVLLRDRLMFTLSQLKTFERAKNNDADSIEELKKAASRYKPYAFIVREMVLYNNRTEFLPTDDEEVEWLIDDFVWLLNNAIRVLAAHPRDTRETNIRDRYAYALAVLMMDPPALSQGAIKNRIPAGAYPEVEQRFQELQQV